MYVCVCVFVCVCVCVCSWAAVFHLSMFYEIIKAHFVYIFLIKLLSSFLMRVLVSGSNW